MKSIVEKHGFSELITVDSAGTIGYHSGSPSDHRSKTHGMRRGYIFDHLARQVKMEDFQTFDYIVAMDRKNLAELELIAQHNKGKAQLSLLMSHDPSGNTTEVPDPYYGGPNGFENVLDLVEKGCGSLFEEICNRHGLTRTRKTL